MPKGHTNNPRGRPPLSRSLTTLLERAGSVTVPTDDGNVARKRLVAEMVWRLAATGRATFPDGTTVPCDDWLAVVKWIYAQVDGPPPQVSSVTLAGDPEAPLTVLNFLPPPLLALEGDADGSA